MICKISNALLAVLTHEILQVDQRTSRAHSHDSSETATHSRTLATYMRFLYFVNHRIILKECLSDLFSAAIPLCSWLVDRESLPVIES